MELVLSGQIFEKYSCIKFNENSPSGRWVVPCGRTEGQTDRHDEANSRLSQFCERAQNKLPEIVLLRHIAPCVLMWLQRKNLWASLSDSAKAETVLEQVLV
jgi:hypothetical protein